MVGFFELPLQGVAAFFASLLGSVAGSGGTALLLPVLVLYVGAQDAIPILTIANLSSNLTIPVVGWFSLGSLPLALTGPLLFVVTSPLVLRRIFGAFLLLTAAWRRLRLRRASFGSVEVVHSHRCDLRFVERLA